MKKNNVGKRIGTMCVVLALLISAMPMMFSSANVRAEEGSSIENYIIYGTLVDKFDVPVDTAIVVAVDLDTGNSTWVYAENGTYTLDLVDINGTVNVGDTIKLIASNGICISNYTFVLAEPNPLRVDFILDPEEPTPPDMGNPFNPHNPFEYNSSEFNSSSPEMITPEFKPDLIITELSFSDDRPVQGDIIILTATVTITGMFTESFAVAFYIDQKDTEHYIASKTVTPSPLETTTDVSVIWHTDGIVGQHVIYVVVDPDNLIDESNETNNELSKKIYVLTVEYLIDKCENKIDNLKNEIESLLTKTDANKINNHLDKTVDWLDDALEEYNENETEDAVKELYHAIDELWKATEETNKLWEKNKLTETDAGDIIYEIEDIIKLVVEISYVTVHNDLAKDVTNVETIIIDTRVGLLFEKLGDCCNVIDNDLANAFHHYWKALEELTEGEFDEQEFYENVEKGYEKLLKAKDEIDKYVDKGKITEEFGDLLVNKINNAILVFPPDLSITVYDIVTDGLLINGETTSLKVTVRNTGMVYAENVKINVYQMSETTLLASTTITRIDAGSEVTKTFDITPVGEEFHRFEVIINPESNVIEADKVDNTVSRTMYIVPLGAKVRTIDGDWIVNNTPPANESEIIELRGNLIITPTGHLIFKKNVTLMMWSVDYRGQYGIYIQHNNSNGKSGRFDVMNDSTIMMHDATTYTYNFISDGTLNIKNQSTIRDMYGDRFNPPHIGGIQLYSTSICNITDSIVTEGETHNIYADGASSRIINSTISWAGSASGIGNGIYCVNGASPVIEGCLVDNSKEAGIFVENANATIRDNEIKNNTLYGIYYSNSGIFSPTIEKNLVEHNKYGIYANNSALMIKNNSPLTITLDHSKCVDWVSARPSVKMYNGTVQVSVDEPVGYRGLMKWDISNIPKEGKEMSSASINYYVPANEPGTMIYVEGVSDDRWSREGNLPEELYNWPITDVKTSYDTSSYIGWMSVDITEHLSDEIAREDNVLSLKWNYSVAGINHCFYAPSGSYKPYIEVTYKQGIYNNDYGIYCINSSATIVNNTISNNNEGVRLEPEYEDWYITGGAHKHALLIGSANDLGDLKDADSIPAQTLQAYYVLRYTGYSDDNITLMLWRDNNSGADDWISIDNPEHNALWGPDNDPNTMDDNPQIDFDHTTPITKELLKQQIISLAENVTKDDEVLIYLVNHGTMARNGSTAYFCFEASDNETGWVSEYEMKEWLSWIQQKCSRMIVLVDTCYSGSFIESLREQNRICVSASADCPAYAFPYVGDGYPFAGEFFFHPFWESISKNKSIQQAYEDGCNTMYLMMRIDSGEVVLVSVEKLQNPHLIQELKEEGMVNIVNNIISSNGHYGIYSSYQNISITNNVITETGGYWYELSYSIYSSFSSSIIINNTIEKSNIGIYTQHAPSLKIRGNTISNITSNYKYIAFGIYCYFSSSVTIENNNVLGCRGGNSASTDYNGASAFGIGFRSSVGSITKNNISDCMGGDGYSASFKTIPTYGGEAYGIICLYSSLILEGNNVSNCVGGEGGTVTFTDQFGQHHWGRAGGNGIGVVCDHSTVVIENTTISNCVAGNGGDGNAGVGGDAGGISCYSSSATVKHNDISNCIAGRGGSLGYYTYGGYAVGIYFEMVSSVIEGNNIAYCIGGGGGSNPGNLGFPGPSGGPGIGIYCVRSSPSIALNNISNYQGGMAGQGEYPGNPGHGVGILCCVDSNPSIIKNKIYGSPSKAGPIGGIVCDFSSPLIKQNEISGNIIGVWCSRASLATINNNTIKANIYGIYSDSSDPEIVNNTILDSEYGVYFTKKHVFHGLSGAIRADTGTYRVVYFAFGFEAINSPTDRNIVMGNVMDWLNPSSTTVLLVDDDGGKSYEAYYIDALNANSLPYMYWDVKGSGSPSNTTLKSYDTVIWLTGDEYYDTLTPFDQTNLADYLNNSGRLFITGQYIGHDLWYFRGYASKFFYENYLHASYDDTYYSFKGKGLGIYLYNLSGVTSDPVTNGISICIENGDGADNQYYQEGIKPNDINATTIFTYKTAPVKVEDNAFSLNDYGIYVYNYPDAVIDSNTLGENDYGVYCSVDSSRIINNVISTNNNGIYCNQSSSTIKNNSIQENEYGVYSISSNSTILNNTINGNSYGIYYAESNEGKIAGNSIRGHSHYRTLTIVDSMILYQAYGCGIYCQNASIQISDDNSVARNLFGIECNVSSVSINHNTIRDHNERYPFFTAPDRLTGRMETRYIWMGSGLTEYSSTADIRDNAFITNRCDISVYNSSGTINGNYVSGSISPIWPEPDLGSLPRGIQCYDSSLLYITNNTVSERGYGIYSDNASNTAITYNIISNYTYGIYDYYTLGTEILYNKISYGEYGVFLCNAHDRKIWHNEICYNGAYGLKGYNSVVDYCINYNNYHNNNIAYYLDPSIPLPIQVFDRNILENNTIGIKVSDISALSITNNTISNNDIGICLTNSSPSIKYNIIRDNRIGIYCEESSNPLVRYNNIYSNTEFGIKNDDAAITIDATYNWWGTITPTQTATPLASISWYCTYLPFLENPFNVG